MAIGLIALMFTLVPAFAAVDMVANPVDTDKKVVEQSIEQKSDDAQKRS
uniref:Uncharacterized protein n=1 Tax=Magnetococcus massalia (strain MO-1) TaxID=451514 RepID=A0A1S7LK69_MAGMO|nr:exported protein of unknown function [Candidatus Magnetococcus massalia]CRH06804.1 exported protein of unknown function [Candidatus Magnetococcus massalia]